jgi:hypothetical protein
MAENVLKKIKGFFSNKAHNERKLKKQKEEHDVLVEAIDQPVVKEPSPVVPIKQNSPEAQEHHELQKSNHEMVLKDETAMVSKKKDYKSIYQKHMQDLSDKGHYSDSIYSHKDSESYDDDDNDAYEFEEKQKDTEQLNKKETSFFRNEPQEDAYKKDDDEDQENKEDSEKENDAEPKENQRESIDGQEENKTLESEDDSNRSEEPTVPNKDIEKDSNENLITESKKGNYEFLSRKEPKEEHPKLKKFFNNDNSPRTTGLNRFKDTTEGYEFLNRKEISKPKNKPNYNKVNY